MEIFLGVGEVGGGHCEPHLRAECREGRLGTFIEAIEDSYFSGSGRALSFGGIADGNLMGIDGIDEVFLDALEVLFGEVAF